MREQPPEVIRPERKFPAKSWEILPPNRGLSRHIANWFPPGYQGYCVDVGAADGISVSTTYELEELNGWTVLSVEANPEFGYLLHRHRAFVEMCACSDHDGEETFHINTMNPEALSSLKPTDRKELLHGYTPLSMWQRVTVKVRTLESLLRKWEFPRLDALCIDTEGTELDVLKGIDLGKWKPLVVVTECWDDTGPIDPYLAQFGYEKKTRNMHNDIFIRRG